jgi:hypothetical protein
MLVPSFNLILRLNCNLINLIKPFVIRGVTKTSRYERLWISSLKCHLRGWTVDVGKRRVCGSCRRRQRGVNY